jgi:hypothetical protein
MGTWFSAPLQTGPEAQTTFCTMGTGVHLSGIKGLGLGIITIAV